MHITCAPRIGKSIGTMVLLISYFMFIFSFKD